MSRINIQIDHDAERLIQRFNTLAHNIRAGVRSGLQRSLLTVETRVRQGSGVRFRRGMAGLAGRLTSYSRLSGPLGIDAAIGFRRTSGFPYELAQEFGARAAPGKAMAVPVSPMAQRMSDRGQGPRDWAPGELFRMRNTRVLAHRPGPKAKPEVHYVLVKSIPPRLRFVQTVRDNRGEIERGIMSGAREGAQKS